VVLPNCVREAGHRRLGLAGVGDTRAAGEKGMKESHHSCKPSFWGIQRGWGEILAVGVRLIEDISGGRSGIQKRNLAPGHYSEDVPRDCRISRGGIKGVDEPRRDCISLHLVWALSS